MYFNSKIKKSLKSPTTNVALIKVNNTAKGEELSVFIFSANSISNCAPSLSTLRRLQNCLAWLPLQPCGYTLQTLATLFTEHKNCISLLTSGKILNFLI